MPPAGRGRLARLVAPARQHVRQGHGRLDGPPAPRAQRRALAAEPAEDRYRLVVTVNDRQVYEAEVRGPAEGKLIRVPARALRAGGNNRVAFDVEGRGQFGYAVTLTGFTRDFGPDQDRAGRSALIRSRDVLAAEPELDGKPLPTGFGVAVNPETVRAQMESGIAFGLGAALHSKLSFKDGRVQQSNFHDYQVLRLDEMPVVEVHIVPSTEKPGGIGEVGVPPIAPAVANAVAALTGQRLRELPLRLNG